jgi:hypothetical protein
VKIKKEKNGVYLTQRGKDPRTKPVAVVVSVAVVNAASVAVRITG